MNETSHVYLLLFPERGLFKIGKADDVTARAGTLAKDWGAPDMDRSWHVKVQRSHVFGLEKSLHFLLGGYRETFDTGDGRTEMFRIDGLIAALNGISVFASSHPGSVNIAKGLLGMLRQEPALVSRLRPPTPAVRPRATGATADVTHGEAQTGRQDPTHAATARNLQKINYLLTVLHRRQDDLSFEVDRIHYQGSPRYVVRLTLPDGPSGYPRIKELLDPLFKMVVQCSIEYTRIMLGQAVVRDGGLQISLSRLTAYVDLPPDLAPLGMRLNMLLDALPSESTALAEARGQNRRREASRMAPAG
jgi:hypothetical protein